MFWAETRSSLYNVVCAIERQYDRPLILKYLAWDQRSITAAQNKNSLIALFKELKQAIEKDDPIWSLSLANEIYNFNKEFIGQSNKELLLSEAKRWYSSFPDLVDSLYIEQIKADNRDFYEQVNRTPNRRSVIII